MLSLIVAIVVLSSGSGEDAASERAVASARAAVAEREGLKLESIEAEDVAPREWPDASLGCPEKGKLYAQMMTRGYRVLLRVGKTVRIVHVAGAHAVICGSPLAAAAAQPEPADEAREAASPEPEAPAQRALVAQAREDLARRLSLAPGDVSLVKSKEVVWPNRGFGCPRPGVVHPQVPQDGLLIVLQAAGRRYNYHSGAGRSPFLCSNPDAPSTR
jgi:hypothetical protein